MPEVLVAAPPLMALAALIVAYGLIRFGSVWIGALFGAADKSLGWVPWLGSKVTAKLSVIEQHVNSRLQAAAAGLEVSIGKTWHVLAAIVEQSGVAMVEAVRAAAHVYWLVSVKYPLDAIQYAAHHAARRVTIINRTYPTTVREIKVSRKALAAAVATALAGAAITKHIVVTHVTEIRTLPAKVGYTARQLRHMLARLRRLERITAGLGAVALVATALRRMGLGWIRCPALSRVGRQIGCSGFAALEDLLAPAAEALVVLDLCRFALAAQQLAREFVPALGLVILTADAICLGGGASLPSAHDSRVISARIRLPSASD